MVIKNGWSSFPRTKFSNPRPISEPKYATQLLLIIDIL
jgi:hypothetical protein